MNKLSTAPTSDLLRTTLTLPQGARFYRCALQVNPFAYLVRHNKQSAFSSEAEYNAAIVKSCLELDIEVIAVTDHYRVKESAGLIQAARGAGLFVFGGFEASTKDGVHFLCLFDPDKDSVLERYIGDCGVHSDEDLSPTGSKDCLELLECAKRWGGICIAAHVASNGGLLWVLKGQPRIKVWASPDMLACALAGPIDQAPENLRGILQNKDGEHRRDRPVAVINAQDVNSPEDLDTPGSSCFVKMSYVSVEGLRQAFLDPDSRIRLNGEPPLLPRAEFLAMTWEGGFLAGTSVHFNGNLNVLVGGRGTGKSTMIESMRYALGLEPLGEEARKAHEGVVGNVLRAGTKVSLLVRSHKPSPRSYTIERTVPNPPIVKDEAGQVLTLTPKDVMPGVEVFGQHEISELTKSREKLTLLLERFVERDPHLSVRKSELRLELERSRSRIVGARREMTDLDERLSTLPGLEETEKRYQEAGLEKLFKEKSLLISEERVFTTVDERIEPIKTLHGDLVGGLPVDMEFVSAEALKDMPNAPILADMENILGALGTKLNALADQIAQALAEADSAIKATKSRWEEKSKVIEEAYETRLREVQKTNLDGAEFIQLRRQIEGLSPLKNRKILLERDLRSYESERRALLSEWEDVKAKEYRGIEAAAKKVSRRLRDRVKVQVAMAGDRSPFEKVLREVGGNLSTALDKLRSSEQLSLPEFAERCREGKDSLMKSYGLTSGTAERIARVDPELFMRIEELDLPATTIIELNTASEGDPATWQTLEALSTGQKATAVLLLLLLESEAPLVVDQPEDDLDNRFITEGVVPIMRQEKRRRQFVFSTHNANIPVLGDAELILGLVASGEAQDGRAKIAPEHMGSIDTQPVRELVEEILEGGKDAFEMRRSKYGF